MSRSRSGEDRTLITPKEAAALLGVSAQTVGRWQQQGVISGMRTLGGHRRYSLADIERLIAERRT